ncbi:MAG: glycosyltransferase family 2 protein [Nitrososphaerales archaeon]
MRESGFEIIVMKGFTNVSRARNLGVSKSHGDLVVFLDDDIKFDMKFLMEEVIQKVRNGMAVAFDPPLIMGIMIDDFRGLGGFDERIPFMAETMEFFWRIKVNGMIVISPPMDRVIHYGGKYNLCKALLNHRNWVFIAMKYYPKNLLSIIFSKRNLKHHTCSYCISIHFTIGWSKEGFSKGLHIQIHVGHDIWVK